jgi:hypothetical protein
MSAAVSYDKNVDEMTGLITRGAKVNEEEGGRRASTARYKTTRMHNQAIKSDEK